jgi:hypothetical protein
LVHITDDLTGLMGGAIRFSNPAGQVDPFVPEDVRWDASAWAGIYSSREVSGSSPLDCTYRFDVTIPQHWAGSETGTWVTTVDLEDHARQWASVPSPATFEQTAPPNPAAPSLVEFSFPPLVNTSPNGWMRNADGEWLWHDACAAPPHQCDDASTIEERRITFTMRIVTDGSPFEMGVVSFRGGFNTWPAPPLITAADRVSGDAYDGIYVSSLEAPWGQPHGDYPIDQIVLFNAAGNGRWLHPADLAANGLPNTIHNNACLDPYDPVCENYPEPLGSTTGPFTQVSVGGQHTCALTPAGDAACWGRNVEGEAPPAGVTGPFTQLAVAYLHTCALTSGGDVACWGGEGSLGQDYGQAPANTSGPFTQFSTSNFHTCGITLGGDATCWGINNVGQAPPAGVAGPFTQIAAGGQFTCALTPPGDVSCWGDNTSGQAPPEGVSGPFTQIASGHVHACGLTLAGDVRCWGDNSNSQAPAIVDGPFIQVSAAGLHTCALTAGGDVTCWGDENVEGQAPASTIGPFTQIVSGGRHTCALTPDGDATCWGANNFEQLGS